MTAAGRTLALAALLAASGHVAAASAAAAGPELEAWDLRKCLQWAVRPAPEPVRSAAWRAARARTRPGLEIYAAQAELPGGGELHKFGTCSFRRIGGKARLGCVPGLDFPLAGANFVAADAQPVKSVTALRCTAGCDQKIPEIVYEIRAGMADDEAAAQREERARSARFYRACPR